MPCKQTKPLLESVAEQYAGKVEFLALDVESSQELVRHYRILAVPTLLIFDVNQELSRVTGAQDALTYQGVFEALVRGEEFQVPMRPIDRWLRIGAGVLLAAVGLLTSNWLVIGIAVSLAFWGIYDRCPVWLALKNRLSF